MIPHDRIVSGNGDGMQERHQRKYHRREGPGRLGERAGVARKRERHYEGERHLGGEEDSVDPSALGDEGRSTKKGRLSGDAR